MKKIIHFVQIRAPSDEVFRALTTLRGLSGWWSTSVDVDVGSVGFRFAGDFNPRMRVTALEPGKRVAWKCEAGHDNWHDNTFTFELREDHGETGLHFVQTYAKELSDEVYGNYNFNWGYYLASLKKLCETGQGTPFEAK